MIIHNKIFEGKIIFTNKTLIYPWTSQLVLTTLRFSKIFAHIAQRLAVRRFAC